MEEGGLPRSLAFTVARGGDVGAREDVGAKAKRRSEVREGASGRGGREHASGLGEETADARQVNQNKKNFGSGRSRDVKPGVTD
jgi:hypothetical protein